MFGKGVRIRIQRPEKRGQLKVQYTIGWSKCINRNTCVNHCRVVIRFLIRSWRAHFFLGTKFFGLFSPNFTAKKWSLSLSFGDLPAFNSVFSQFVFTRDSNRPFCSTSSRSRRWSNNTRRARQTSALSNTNKRPADRHSPWTPVTLVSTDSDGDFSTKMDGWLIHSDEVWISYN